MSHLSCPAKSRNEEDNPRLRLKGTEAKTRPNLIDETRKDRPDLESKRLMAGTSLQSLSSYSVPLMKGRLRRRRQGTQKCTGNVNQEVKQKAVVKSTKTCVQPVGTKTKQPERQAQKLERMSTGDSATVWRHLTPAQRVAVPSLLLLFGPRIEKPIAEGHSKSALFVADMLCRQSESPSSQHSHSLVGSLSSSATSVSEALTTKNSPQFNLPTEIVEKIILMLDFGSRYSFARACSDMNQWVKNITQTWDISRGNFGGAETGQRIRLGHRGGQLITSSAVTVILSDPTAPNAGYMGWNLTMIKKVTIAFYNIGDKIRRLELHKTPLLTTTLLSLLVPNLANLEYLGVFRCDLIDLLDASELLEIIRRGRSAAVQLDFIPSLADRDLANIEFSIAIPTILYKILPQARKQQARLLERPFQFHQYLKGLHIGITDELLSAIEYERIDQLVLCHLSRMKTRKLKWNREEPICWGCRYAADLKLAKSRQDTRMSDFTKHVGKWLNKCDGLEDAIRLAKEDKGNSIATDRTWASLWRNREERHEIADHVRKGHLKPGQTLEDLKGRHCWAKIRR